MKFNLVLLFGIGLFCSVTTLWAQDVVKVGDHKPDSPSLPVAVSEYDDSWQKFDVHGTGTIDYAVKYDPKGNIQFEAFSHRQNGYMDYFRFYEAGVPVREEIDTTGTHKIDLWVYLYQGIYISRYEKSSKHDGVVDIVKVFGKNKS